MTSRVFTTVLGCLVLVSQSLSQDPAALNFTIWPSGAIDIRTNGDVELSSLSLSSAGDFLIPGATPAPFSRFQSNTPSEIVFVNDDGPATIDGFVRLSARYDKTNVPDFDFLTELRAEWDDGGFATGLQVSPGGDPLSFVLPEPSSGILTAIGLVAIFGCRRQR